MDSATVDLYLQKIEEFVHDEDKIVTFKWLSVQLGISVQDAKQLLKQYVIDQRDSKPDTLSVAYSLSGICLDNVLAVTVVKENELEDKKNAFTAILDQEIYSVQKSKDSDLTAVSLVDYFDMHNPREVPVLGSIRSKHSIKRVFKTKKALPAPREPTIKGKMSMFMKVPQKSSEKSETTTLNSNQATVKEVTKTTKPKQNGAGIASFFNKSLSQADTKQKTQEKPVKEENIEPKEEPAVKEDVTPKSSVEKIQNLVDTDSEAEESSIQSTTSKPSKENQKPKRNNKRQRKQNKKNAPSPKRRKRIVEQEESDDDIFGNDDEENIHESVIENSDEDPEPVVSVKPPLPPKNKKRKLVDRTFTDEDGYIITRKEWIEENPSEDESEQNKEDTERIKLEIEQVKTELKRKATDDENNVDNNKKMKKSVNGVTNEKVVNGKAKNAKGKKGAATNQPTLMNFFKRS